MYIVWLFDKAGHRSSGNTFATKDDAIRYAQDIVYPNWDGPGWVRWIIQENTNQRGKHYEICNGSRRKKHY